MSLKRFLSGFPHTFSSAVLNRPGGRNIIVETDKFERILSPWLRVGPRRSLGWLPFWRHSQISSFPLCSRTRKTLIVTVLPIKWELLFFWKLVWVRRPGYAVPETPRRRYRRAYHEGIPQRCFGRRSICSLGSARSLRRLGGICLQFEGGFSEEK